jgi:hypothetical protein
MAKFSYIRPTKLHPENEQRAELCASIGCGAFDEEYLDAKPKRGAPGWYWWDKLVRSCRPGCSDEVHVSTASVIADSVPIALKRIGDLTAREAVLVVASTGKRYTWHPDAALAIDLALEMAAEARRLVAKIGGEAFARNQAARRERAAKKMAEIERLWLDPTVSTGDALRAAGGLSRHSLYKRFGPRGTPRFGRDA